MTRKLTHDLTDCPDEEFAYTYGNTDWCYLHFFFTAGNELASRLREREPTLDASFSLDNFVEAARAVNLAVCPTEVSILWLVFGHLCAV